MSRLPPDNNCPVRQPVLQQRLRPVHGHKRVRIGNRGKNHQQPQGPRICPKRKLVGLSR